MNNQKSIGIRILIVFSSFLLVLLLIGQTYSLFNYEHAVSLGLQESIDEIGPVGIAFAKGFALGDTVIYIPLLLIGIIGLLRKKKWGVYAMLCSLAISAYWPIVHLYAINIETESIVLSSEKYLSYMVTLILITLYGLWGMWYLYRNEAKIATQK
jgi:hypothetical protein